MIQVVEMSYSEKVEMYNLVSKDKLIEMLIEANRHLSNINPTVKLTIPDISKSVCKHCSSTDFIVQDDSWWCLNCHKDQIK